MSYPLTMRFKILAIARQFSVRDSSDRLLMYVKQKAFKLREAITVYADETQTQPLYYIHADRIIDFSAKYRITDAAGEEIGMVQQRGMRSIWRARYDVYRGDDIVFTIQEENPLAKVADSFLAEIPIIGFLSSYLFHPRYLVSTAAGEGVLRVKKRPSMFEALFSIERLPEPLSPEDERLLLIGTVTAALLERSRG